LRIRPDVYGFENTTIAGIPPSALRNELLEKLLANEGGNFTTHTAFYTDEAITRSSPPTLDNLNDFTTTGSCINEYRTIRSRPKMNESRDIYTELPGKKGKISPIRQTMDLTVKQRAEVKTYRLHVGEPNLIPPLASRHRPR
jgi:hypothetical protein